MHRNAPVNSIGSQNVPHHHPLRPHHRCDARAAVDGERQVRGVLQGQHTAPRPLGPSPGGATRRGAGARRPQRAASRVSHVYELEAFLPHALRIEPILRCKSIGINRRSDRRACAPARRDTPHRRRVANLGLAAGLRTAVGRIGEAWRGTVIAAFPAHRSARARRRRHRKQHREDDEIPSQGRAPVRSGRRINKTDWSRDSSLVVFPSGVVAGKFSHFTKVMMLSRLRR
jgi:hypothetical protein